MVREGRRERVVAVHSLMAHRDAPVVPIRRKRPSWGRRFRPTGKGEVNRRSAEIWFTKHLRAERQEHLTALCSSLAGGRITNPANLTAHRKLNLDCHRCFRHRIQSIGFGADGRVKADGLLKVGHRDLGSEVELRPADNPQYAHAA